MKGTERQKYLTLLEPVTGHYGLCNFCKFADWEGGSCCESSVMCQHPLPIINEGTHRDYPDHPTEVWGDGADCWGFRPNRSFEDIAICIGIHLEGNIPHTSKTYGEIIAIIPSEYERELYGL